MAARGLAVAILAIPVSLRAEPVIVSSSMLAGTTLDSTTTDTLAPDLQAQFATDGASIGVAFDSLTSPFGAARNDAPFDDKSFTSTTLALASDLHIRLGAVAANSPGADLPAVSDLEQLQLSRAAEHDAGSLLAGADVDIASWGGLGIAASQTTRSDYDLSALTGAPNIEALFGVYAHVDFGGGWMTSFSYDERRVQFDLMPNTLAIANREGEGREFDFSVSKSDVFGSDALGLSWVRPVQPSDSVLLAPQVSLSSATPESDFQLDYETSFNSNITLQANAGYQVNVGGQNGAKAISVLSRAKINF